MPFRIALRRCALLPALLLSPLALLAACDEPPNEQRIDDLEEANDELEDRLQELEERVRVLEQGRAS